MKFPQILLLCMIALTAITACNITSSLAADTASQPPSIPTIQASPTPTQTPTLTPSPTPVPLNPLTIASMRQRYYPGSSIVIEQTLEPGSNYKRYIVSYQSDGLKIFALMTIPNGTKPQTGWPVIIFNHGYIPPAQYKTTERYVAYVDGFAKSGYIVFRSDYRGHDKSEGMATGAYGSPDYTVDVLNAVASLKQYKDADPNRIGMWGHSMGGYITLRTMVINKDIQAGVIWAGVVGSYPDMMYNWRRTSEPTPTPNLSIPATTRRWRQNLIDQYGTPEQNSQFWNSISANSFLNDLSGPLQLHHGTSDAEVPIEFSQKLYDQVKLVGKTVEFYSYKGDNHNISINFSTAMQRSVQFFNKYLKAS